jgi:hypothetical protein
MGELLLITEIEIDMPVSGDYSQKFLMIECLTFSQNGNVDIQLCSSLQNVYQDINSFLPGKTAYEDKQGLLLPL